MSATGTAIVDEVKKFAGDPYLYGATGPSSFDCSGLVQYTLGKLGITAPRTSEAQWGWVQKITQSQLQPGDLVFAQFPGDNASPGHVGVYTGGGQVLSAEDPAQGVGYASLSSWAGNIVGYGRVPGTSYKGEPAGAGSSGGGGGLLSLFLPADVTGMFSAAEGFVSKLMWIMNPESWARIVAGVFGFFLLAFGVGFLVAAA